MEPVLPDKQGVRERAVINARRAWEPQGSHCKGSAIPSPPPVPTPASSNSGAAAQVSGALRCGLPQTQLRLWSPKIIVMWL